MVMALSNCNSIGCNWHNRVYYIRSHNRSNSRRYKIFVILLDTIFYGNILGFVLEKGVGKSVIRFIQKIYTLVANWCNHHYGDWADMADWQKYFSWFFYAIWLWSFGWLCVWNQSAIILSNLTTGIPKIEWAFFVTKQLWIFFSGLLLIIPIWD